jgi:uncharacterized membrane protein YhiD involved in acid resistance
MEVRRARGTAPVGCLIGFAILVLAILIGVKVLPVRLAVAELQDYCERQADQATLPGNSDEKIAAMILKRAEEKHLAVTEDDIHVWRDATEIHIVVKYRVVLPLVITSYDWDVEHKVDRPLFIG